MRVRLVATAAVVALIACSTLAPAQTGAPKKALGKLTCEEFLAYEDTFKPKVVYWAVAYGKGGKAEAAMLDVEGTEKVIPVIIEKCKAAPKDSFLKTVKAESSTKPAAAKK
jgi:acid stress chaperone HdeA